MPPSPAPPVDLARDEHVAGGPLGAFGPLLERTSRTFALTIPLLPPPTSHEVAVAYLLFRIADTLEDAELWTRDERLGALRSFERWVGGDDDDGFLVQAGARPPTTHAGYLELLRRAGEVRDALDGFAPEAANEVRARVADTTRRMAAFVARQDDAGRIALTDERDLRAYCYAVAGIVGELLTKLFVLATPTLADVEATLDRHARAFGEGLQLVNILKDAASDARDGRSYLPADRTRDDVVRLARGDLDDADLYVGALRRGGAPSGVVAFCALPVALARATLDALERGETKVPRAEALAIARRITEG